MQGSGAVKGGGKVETHMDHRIAMAFLVLGLAARDPVTVGFAIGAVPLNPTPVALTFMFVLPPALKLQAPDS